MRFYINQHQFYCGIDLHARSLYVCILNQAGETLVHKNLPADPDTFLSLIAPCREGIAVAVECTFTWYWLADLCRREKITFVLGHALYMKAIHGAKTRNDRVDSRKIAGLLRGGMFPIAYVYPSEMRATRDLMRRSTYLVRKRGDLLAHIQNTNSQWNLPGFGRKIAYHVHREGAAQQFEDPAVQMAIEVDLDLIDHYDILIGHLERYILRNARKHDPQDLMILRTVHGIGKVLSLVILYEIHDVHRFPRVQDFASYARLVKCAKESAAKHHSGSGQKIGNAHLKWAFSEAAVLFLRANPEALNYKQRLIHSRSPTRTSCLLHTATKESIRYE